MKLAKGVLNDTDLTVEDLEKIVTRYKNIILKETGKEFVQDIHLQLIGSIEAVFHSWMNERAIIYRKLNDIYELLENERKRAINIFEKLHQDGMDPTIIWNIKSKFKLRKQGLFRDIRVEPY